MAICREMVSVESQDHLPLEKTWYLKKEKPFPDHFNMINIRIINIKITLYQIGLFFSTKCHWGGGILLCKLKACNEGIIKFLFLWQKNISS